MKFSANLTALPGLAELLYRRRDDLITGRDFVARHAVLEPGEVGMLNACLGVHEEVVAAVSQFLGNAAHLRADYLGHGVAQCVNYYRTADISAATALDASYGSGYADGYPPPPQADQSLGPQIFIDHACSSYAEPRDYHDENRPIQSKLDWLSPTTDIREAVWQVTKWATDLHLMDHPTDTARELIEPFTGDWAAFRACADVWRTVGVEVGLQYASIERATQQLPRVWTGHAATDCDNALTLVGSDLRDAAGTLGNLALAYEETAETIKELTGLLITEYTVLGDTAISALLEQAAPLEKIAIIGKVVEHVERCAHLVSLAWHQVEIFRADAKLVRSEFGVVGKPGPLALHPLGTVHVPAPSTGESADQGTADARTPQPV
jgi:hypothetical protein